MQTLDARLGPSLVRPHSLCNSPREKGRYLICVRRDDAGRGGSRTLHRDLTMGRRLRISPPRNHFPLAAAGHHVLVAARVGIAPLLSMAEARAARGASFVLHHYSSNAAEAPLPERLQTSALGERAVTHHSDQGDTVHAGLPAELQVPEPDTAIHVCGPDGFMTHVVTEATAAGRRPGQLHAERFAPAAPPSTEDRAPALRDDQGRRPGVLLDCAQGTRGACPTPVLTGEPDHRNEVQTPDERAAGDRITICRSPARTPELLLDF
ncbi:vanillate O-demethylase ferredoxin subunit [Streptomyces sp. TLI_55]|uniref:PDR/VanB family oxidoreductase n=1 Tax=Streptomyces sp. TLI_55 TaxID=1938861 RepID=UPI000BD84AB3|nr:PDR/VanB family oxidoreductase [Streptomyces sp. TLI_55]SNX66599.1 vanillate O-demethylase ferredoxin subunit [Streptomyces sp. TLI_55]